MLKIKNDIKLSKLKQYGFERCGAKYIYSYNMDKNGCPLGYADEWFEICVNKDRSLKYQYMIEICINDYPKNLLNPTAYSKDETIECMFDILYDMIQDGIVEKVD